MDAMALVVGNCSSFFLYCSKFFHFSKISSFQVVSGFRLLEQYGEEE
jgi:hypothetical protein